MYHSLEYKSIRMKIFLKYKKLKVFIVQNVPFHNFKMYKHVLKQADLQAHNVSHRISRSTIFASEMYWSINKSIGNCT